MVRLSRKLSSLCDSINKCVVNISAVLLFLMLIFSVIAIFFRYFLGNPLAWAEDILLPAFVWMSLLGISIAFRASSHMAIESFINLLSSQKREKLIIAGQSMIVGLSVFLTIEGVKMVFATTSTRWGVLQLPPTYFYISFPFAFSLISIYGIDEIIRKTVEFDESMIRAS
ncbi:MAG: TRAP transporter small permease subunit [Desulfobacteraceae bacterium]|nr:MAG: TRAP transporter small permease subunit [Desulfobacteraceae bacterium]